MYKTIEGLVLKRTRFKESNAYITALTNEGLITFTAFGILSPKNKNFSSAAIYTFSEFVLKTQADSATLSQATTISHLIRQGVDFESLSLANYLSSLAIETAFDRDDAPSILSLLVSALKRIDKKDAPCDIVKAVFEFRLMAALGFSPDLYSCALCQGDTREGLFVPSEGSLICKKCIVPDGVRGISLSAPLVSAIEKVLTLAPSAAFGIRFSDENTKAAFVTAAENFSAEHLDCAKKALKFYKDNMKNFI